MGNHTKSIAEIQVDSVCQLPDIIQGGYLIVEGNQVCQVLFALGESVLAFFQSHASFGL